VKSYEPSFKTIGIPSSSLASREPSHPLSPPVVPTTPHCLHIRVMPDSGHKSTDDTAVTVTVSYMFTSAKL
jgi:hypothetical protein